MCDNSAIARKVNDRVGCAPDTNRSRVDCSVGCRLTFWYMRHCIKIVLIGTIVGFFGERLAEFGNKPGCERNKIATP